MDVAPEELPVILPDAKPAEKLEVGWLMRAFHGKLRRARRAKGLTQKQAGAVFGLHQSRYGEIELFKFKPDYSLRVNIADFFGLTPEEVWPDWLEPQAASLAAVAYQDFTPAAFAELTSKQRKEVLLLEDKTNGDPAEECANRELLKKNIGLALNTLTYREREILKLRYGLEDDGMTYTLEECGRIFKITRERVREIEAKALRKLSGESRRDMMKGAAEGAGIVFCDCGEVLGLARFCKGCGKGGCGKCLGRHTEDGKYTYLCKRCQPFEIPV